MAKCEWDPVNDRLAQILAPDVEIGCNNTATVSVGGGAYHLCASCADLPRFKRYRSRVELKLLKPSLPMPSGIPAGYTQLDKYTRVYVSDKWLLVTGTPAEDEDEETGHNCDAMGCGWEHVPYRLPLCTPICTQDTDTSPEGRK